MSGRSTAGDTTTPVVFPDINPVLLMRVHPAAESWDEAEAAAVAQGTATAEAGAEQQASQQEAGKPPEQAPVDIPPPVNKDVPYLGQTGATLNCTMGNWVVTPDSYSYAWTIGGSAVGDVTGPDYTVTPVDVGLPAFCVVTATNAGGSTAAPPSNSVVIA